MPAQAPPQAPPGGPILIVQHAQKVLGDALTQLSNVASAGDSYAQGATTDVQQALDDIGILGATLQAQAAQIQQLSNQVATLQGQAKAPATTNESGQPMAPGTYIKAPVAVVGMLAAAGLGGVGGWFAKGAAMKRKAIAHEAEERRRLEAHEAAREAHAALEEAGGGGEEEET